MEPFSIIAILSSYATIQKVSGLLDIWINGKNIKHLKRALEFFQKGFDNEDVSFFKKAVSEFDHINEEEDKKFVVAATYYHLAICYAIMYEFRLAYHYLNKLDDIEITWSTRNKDTIRELQSAVPQLREKIKEIESNIKEPPPPEKPVNWKFITISLALVVGISILAIVVSYVLF